MEAQITIQKPSGAIQLQALLPNLRTNNVLQVAMLCMVVDLSGLAAYGLAMVDFHKKKLWLSQSLVSHSVLYQNLSWSWT